MQRFHPEEQNSSLGISKALQEEVRALEASQTDNAGRESPMNRTLTDEMFKKVPSNGANFYTWTRFYISLYYNKLAVNMFGFLTGWDWYNKVDDFIFLGALPTPSQIKKLHNQEKVDTVVNLCCEFPGYQKLYKELNIQQIRLETPDFSIPSVELIRKGVEAIVYRKQEKPKSTIYLHCKAGRGRSAVIGVCYLLRTYNLNLNECQALLLSKRTQIDRHLCQTDEIRLYYKDLLSDIEAGKIIRAPFYKM